MWSTVLVALSQNLYQQAKQMPKHFPNADVLTIMSLFEQIIRKLKNLDQGGDEKSIFCQ